MKRAANSEKCLMVNWVDKSKKKLGKSGTRNWAAFSGQQQQKTTAVPTKSERNHGNSRACRCF